jgi:flagellar biosynthesis component FlhA
VATIRLRVRLVPGQVGRAAGIRLADVVRARVQPTLVALTGGDAVDVDVSADEPPATGRMEAAVDGRPAVTSEEFHRPAPGPGQDGAGLARVVAEVAHVAVLDALVRGPSATTLLASGRGMRFSVGLRLSPGYLDELVGATDDLAATVTQLHGQLCVDLGVEVPPVEVELDATVPPGTFALRVGDVVVSERLGLRGDELFLALDPAAVAATGTPGRAETNPVDGSVGAVVDPAHVTDRLASNEHRPVAYDAIGHLVRWVVEDIGRWAALFVDEGAAGQLLDRWAVAQPALVDIVRELVPVRRVAAAMRALLADGAGVPDGSAFLGALVEHVRDDADALDRVDDLRLGMARALVGRSCDSSGMLTAGVLPADVWEGDLARPAVRPAPVPTAGVLQRLAALDPGVPVLVPETLRRPVADALRFARPRRTVLSTAELPAHLPVRTIGPAR